MLTRLTLGTGFIVEEMVLDDESSRPRPLRTGTQLWPLELRERGQHRIDVRYRGRLAPLAQADHRGVLRRSAADGERARQLSAGWQRLVSAGRRPISPIASTSSSRRDSAAWSPGASSRRGRRDGLSRAVRVLPSRRRHRPDGRTVRGRERRCRGAGGPRFACAPTSIPRSRDARRASYLDSVARLHRPLQRLDRRLSVRRVQRRIEPDADRLRHAHAHLSRHRRAAPAVHPRDLARARSAAQLVGQRRLSRLCARQLVARG